MFLRQSFFTGRRGFSVTQGEHSLLHGRIRTMSAVEATEPKPSTPEAERTEFRRFASMVGAGWLFTILGYGIAELPLRFLLKDDLKMGPEAVALFLAIGHFSNYIKPLAGVMT